jgi:hypothetical protein
MRSAKGLILALCWSIANPIELARLDMAQGRAACVRLEMAWGAALGRGGDPGYAPLRVERRLAGVGPPRPHIRAVFVRARWK